MLPQQPGIVLTDVQGINEGLKKAIQWLTETAKKE